MHGMKVSLSYVFLIVEDTYVRITVLWAEKDYFS